MKILYTNFHDGDGGGHTTYIRELARSLAARHEIHVAAPPGSRLLAEAGALPDVHAVAQPFPNGLRKLRKRSTAIRQLRAYLQARAFDIVHVNGSADHRITLAAMRGLPVRPCIVLTKHNTKPMRGLAHAWRAHYGTNKVIAVCEYVRQQMLASPYRVCAPQTICNGVDLDHFAPWPKGDALAARRQYANAEDALLLGSSAGTASYKGWTDLIPALGLLAPEERRRIRIVIAGKSPDDGQLAQLHDAGLQDCFHFPGLLKDVRPVIAALDAGFVLSHAIETISFACREMMAMGKPVLVSSYAGLPENIHNDEDGWVVPVQDPAAIAERLRWMLAQREALASMGASAHRHAREEFGLARFVDATEAAYRELLVNDR